MSDEATDDFIPVMRSYEDRDIKRLIARLDAVTAERDAALTEERDRYKAAIKERNDALTEATHNLRCAQEYQKERDRYKAVLEEVAGLDCVVDTSGATAKGCTCICCSARAALAAKGDQ